VLDKVRDEKLEDVPLAQAFTEGYGHFGIVLDTKRTKTVVMVTSNRSVLEVKHKGFEILGTDCVVRDDPKDYGRLVKPRWDKQSIESYLRGTNDREPQITYRRLKATMERLIDFGGNPATVDIVCCWLIGTYLYRIFEAFPYLGVLGPMGSGKTKLAGLIEEVAFNPIRADSITPAQLFRSVEVTGGTLILDEQESLTGGSFDSERLKILRGGYKKGGKALRSGDGRDGYRTEEFDTFGPKVLINTSGFEEKLANRCIAIHMLRSKEEQGKALVSDHEPELQAVRHELYCLALEVFPQIEAAYRDDEFAGEVNNRQRERWLPIMVVAKLFCPDRLEALLEVAKEDKGANVLVDPFDEAFLLALDALVDEAVTELTTSKIGRRVENILGDSQDVGSGQVGKLIRKYLGNIGRRAGENGSYVYPIRREQVDDLMKRYPVSAFQDSTERTEVTERNYESNENEAA
jgi:hypothetical protein